MKARPFGDPVPAGRGVVLTSEQLRAIRRAATERQVHQELIDYIDGDPENGPRHGVEVTEEDIRAEVDRRLGEDPSSDQELHELGMGSTDIAAARRHVASLSDTDLVAELDRAEQAEDEALAIACDDELQTRAADRSDPAAIAERQELETRSAGLEPEPGR